MLLFYAFEHEAEPNVFDNQRQVYYGVVLAAFVSITNRFELCLAKCGGEFYLKWLHTNLIGYLHFSVLFDFKILLFNSKNIYWTYSC